jgi:hypothetical protein
MSQQQYDNTNRGVLFKNDRKDSENHPDYKGQVNVGGQEFWLSAWIKEGQKGKFMSLSVTPKEEQRQAAPPQRTAPPARNGGGTGRQQRHDDMDSDVPFANPLAQRGVHLAM